MLVASIVVHLLYLGALLDDDLEHVLDLFEDEGETPGEHVHVLGQHVGVVCVVELLDVEVPVLDLNHSRLVVVDVAVVRRGEDGDHGGERLGAVPFMEFVA